MSKLQDKLMPGMKGPDGEDVYTDMYEYSKPLLVAISTLNYKSIHNNNM